MAAYRKNTSDEGFSPNLVVVKDSIDVTKNPTFVIKKIAERVLNSSGSSRIINEHWFNQNAYFVISTSMSNGTSIGHSMLFIHRDGILYLFTFAASNAKDGDFFNYLDLSQEIFFSIQYRGKSVL